MQFATNNSLQIDLDISYVNRLISKACDRKYLGIDVDSTLSWKNHVEQIKHRHMKVCYTVGLVKPFMSQKTLKMVYYTYFHSIMKNGLVFWGKPSHGTELLKIQKNIIRIIRGYRSRDLLRDLFKNLKIPLLPVAIYRV
jgi:hypothetical protein